mgnify:CR=1 FL=1
MYKVLLAEDEDIIRKGLMFTADWGAWNCLVAGEASDGEEGVEKIRQSNRISLWPIFGCR